MNSLPKGITLPTRLPLALLVPLRVSRHLFIVAAIASANPLFAQQPQSPSAEPASVPVVLERLVVSGEQPGPGMWKVTKGTDGGNVLWLIGTHTPVPQKMTWRAKGVEALVSQAQEIITGPSVSISTKQIGFFTALTLLPSAMEGRKNPKGATLKEIVSADIYPRWIRLRDKYVDEYNTTDEDKDIERWRPAFAAFELYSQAIRKSGMTLTDPVWPVIRDAAKKHKVKVSEVMLEPPVKDVRAAVNEFKSSQLADTECFNKTIERIETDLTAMRERANAWAKGDVNALRSGPATNQREACEQALRNASFLKTLGLQNISEQMESKWLEAAEAALAKNPVTVTMLPIRQLVTNDGYLAKLKARGYNVQEPDSMSE